MQTRNRIRIFSALLALAAGAGAQDLVITYVSGPAQWKAGVKQMVSATVKNIGTKTTGRFSVGFYYSQDFVVTTGDSWMGSYFVESLQPNQSKHYGFEVRGPANIKAGAGWIGAIADHEKEVTETFEWNNIRTKGITGIPSPNLVVKSIAIANSITAGAMYTISITTKNEGLAASGASYTGLFTSSSSNYLISPTYMVGVAVPALGPGEESTRVLQRRIPYAARGDMFLAGKTDIYDDVEEGDEDHLFGVARTIAPYAGPGRYLHYRRSLPTNEKGPRTPTFAKFTTEGGKADIDIIAPSKPFHSYILAWSGSAQFQVDAFTDMSLGLINTPYFHNWLGSVDHEGRAAARFVLPKGILPKLFIRTHAFWFTPGFQSLVGTGTNVLQTQVN